MIFADSNGSSAGAHGISIHDAPASVAIRHNTVFVAGSGNGSGVYLATGARSAYVENNIFASAGDGSAALLTEDCPDVAVVQSLRNNLNIGMPLLRYADTAMGSCTSGSTYLRNDLAESELRARCAAGGTAACMRIGGTLVGGNVTVDGSCGADSGCITRSGCVDSASCGRQLFQGSSLGDLGVLFGAGWKLAMAIPCAVAQSSLDLRMPVPTDLYVTPRPATPSMGAHQLDDSSAACVP